ncbi:MAG: Trk system potassium transporter TrkA [Gammaproteobacteria bacterium]|uniref:Trk system potassium uptake protein TrkA n=1 Tax=Candidatus Thiopontia autotrophica TaxID=2841688 RepID=A0A8J6NXW3_9GAMM|nr:Trk system potassium transporter TrkA [Candidatus Thiopontia autotrophica]
MNIIILGAGQVGTTVAENLALESNDVTMVDTDIEQLHALQDRLDIRTVAGHASYPKILAQAGAENAEMILAVTDSDEVNIVACQVAATLFNTPNKIARVRAPEYLERSELFQHESATVDMLISPEQVVTDYIRKLIELPGSLQVLDFADGKVQLVTVRAYYGGPLVGHELQTVREHMPDVDMRFVAIFRKGRPILPKKDTVIEVDDEVHFVVAQENTLQVMGELRRLDRPYQRIMIAGGGNVGTGLACAIESELDVKVIEQNPEKAQRLSEDLSDTIVLLGDAADRDLLLEEGIEDVDVFIAVTSDDEANILSSMLAKRLGAHKVMTLINRPAYANLVESEIIDIAISPQQATISSLLARVRQGDVVVAHSLRRGAAEAIEAIAHDDSKVVNRAIENIKLPRGASIGAIVRGDEVLIAHHDVVIRSGDHVILFLIDKNRIHEVEKLFKPSKLSIF